MRAAPPGGAVRLRAQCGALADGGGAVPAPVRALRLCGLGRRAPAASSMPFAVAAMEEIGLDIAEHRPMTFEELEDWEGLNFDLIVTLAPEAHHKALELTRTIAAEVEYWPTPDPTVAEGSREQRLDAYRAVRDQLMRRIKERFAASRPATNRGEGARISSCKRSSRASTPWFGIAAARRGCRTCPAASR